MNETSHAEKVRVVALDPSVLHCGYASALFTPLEGWKYPAVDAKGDVIEKIMPATWDERTSKWSWGDFRPTCTAYCSRLLEIAQTLTMLYPDGIDLFVAEWPAFYNIERGHVAAVRGDTINLAGINCYVAGWLRIPPERVTFITATQWKGSVSKEITRQRFFKSFVEKEAQKHYMIDHNAVDAAMLLLTWCMRNNLVSKEFPKFTKTLEQDKMISSRGFNEKSRNVTF